MGRRSSGGNKSNIAGGLVIVAAILAIVAVIVNQLIVYTQKIEILGVENKTTYWHGWNKSVLCNKIGDNDRECADSGEYGDSCEADDESDFCKYINAGRTWLALNIVAAVAFVVAAGVIFMKKDGKFSKGAAAIGVICIAVGLIVYYAVADEVGFWDSDPTFYDSVILGWSGFLDIAAAICGIAGGVLG